MEYTTIRFERPEPRLGILSLSRPEAYNAFNYQMMLELEDFWRERLHDRETLVIIMKGDGERGFCAGLDIKEAVERNQQMKLPDHYAFQARLARVNLAMRRAPQPIIAAVHGSACGQGFSLVLASDIRVITPDARFNAAYINIGLGGADMLCSYFLPRMIGAGRAYEFMYTGDFISSEDAMRLGLVSKIVEKEGLLDAAKEYAGKLLQKNPMALRLTKEAINMSLDAGGIEQVLAVEDRNQVLLTLDCLERRVWEPPPR